jgi:hypothetical protein
MLEEHTVAKLHNNKLYNLDHLLNIIMVMKCDITDDDDEQSEQIIFTVAPWILKIH